MVRPSLRHPLSEGAGRKMKQILIVDDDVHIGDMIEEMLTRRGYGVLRAPGEGTAYCAPIPVLRRC